MAKALKVQKRLLPYDVIRKYKQKGVKAIAKRFLKRNYDITNSTVYSVCGCALTVRFCSKKEMETCPIVDVENLATERAKEYGLTESYLTHFIYGFDSSRPTENRSDEALQGYADGQKCMELVRKHKLLEFI